MDNPFLLKPESQSYSGFTADAKADIQTDPDIIDDQNRPLTENPFITNTAGQPLQNPFVMKDTTPDPMDIVNAGFKMGERQIDFVHSDQFEHYRRGAQWDAQHKEELMSGWEKLGRAFQNTTTVKGATSAAVATGNFLASAIGMPASWAAAALSWQQNPWDRDQQLYAMENTREWTDLKNVLKHHGVDPEYLDSPNFLDQAMEIISDKVIKPGQDKYFGDKDSVAKTVYGDIATVALFGAAGKLIPGGKGIPKDKITNVEANNLRNRNSGNPASEDFVGPRTAEDSFVGPPDLRGDKRDLPTPFETPPEQVGPLDVNRYDTLENSDRIVEGYRRVNSKYWKDHPRQPFVDSPETPYPEIRNPGKPEMTSTGLPIIEDHPSQNPFISQLGPDVDTTGKMHNPFIQNVMDQENAQKGPHDVGAHSEMDLRTEPQDPIRGPDATLSYDGGVKQDIENKRALQGSTEGVRREEHAYNPKPDMQLIWEDPKALGAFVDSNNLHDALNVVAKHARREEDRVLAKKILQTTGDANKDVRFALREEHKARGWTLTAPDGEVGVALHPKYGSMTTLVHEAVHVHTNDAINAYEAGTANPKQMSYGKSLSKIFEAAHKELAENGHIPEEFKLMFQNLKEFNAYGLTDPFLQRILHNTPMRGDTLFDRFVQNIKEFFGAPKETAFYKLVKLVDAWPDIQAPDPFTRVENYNKTGRGSIDYAKIPADQNYHETALAAWEAAKGKDLHILNPQNFITPNQVAALSKHPVVGFFMDKMGQIVRQVSPRFHQYARDLQPFMFDRSTKLSRDSIVKSFKTLVDLQDPATKDARAKAEAENTRRQFLQEKGLQGRELDFTIKVLDIMRDVHKADIKSVARLGRTLEYQPMYFPRVHGGRFVLKVLDGNGTEQYVKGFESYAEGRAKQAQLTNQLKGTDYKVQDVSQSNRNDFGDDFTMLLLEHKIPMKFMEKALGTMEKARETAPWSFEKARRDTNVGGYIGEDITNRGEQESLLKVLSWRLQASRNLETKSRMLNEIKFPLFDTQLLGEMPRARLLVGNLLNRELGVDISRVQGFDKLLQGAASTAAKSLKAIGHFEEKFIRGKDVGDFRWDDPMVRDDLARHLARQLTYATSMFKLALNIPVYATNFASIGLLGLDGVRTAALEKVHSGHAMTALFRSWSYFGQEGGARQFMVDARNEGMVESKGQEHYTTAELPDRNTFDRAIQYPRDKIEEATNYAAIHYYYHFWKAAAPELTGEAFKAKVYQSVKSFTGQYESFAGPTMFDKAGTTGQLMTNFAKWHFNQLGRLLVDVKEAGAERNAIPLLMTATMAGIGAGLYGLPGVVEYEGLRRLGQALGGWDLPPVSGLRAQLGKAVDSKHLPESVMPVWEFFERGVLTASSDSLAKLLGANSGPDISGSMRYSAFFDAPTVAIQTLWTAISKLIPAGYKELKTIVGGPGANAKEIEDAFKALPTAITGIMKKAYDKTREPSFFKEKVVGADGSVMWRVKDPSDKGRTLYTQQDIEDTYNQLGLKSKKENKNLEGIYYDKWVERQNQKDITEATQGIMSHIGDVSVFRNNTLKLMELGGPEEVKSMLAQLKQHMKASSFDYFQQQYLDLQKQHDMVKAKKQFERINATKRMVSDVSPVLKDTPLTDDEKVSRDMGAAVSDTKITGPYTGPGNQYPTVNAGVPNLRAHEFEGPKYLGGFMRDKDPNDTVFVNHQWDEKEKTFGLLHETEHILQKKGVGAPPAINSKFDELVKDDGLTRTLMVAQLVEAREHLKTKYGITDSYFDPKMLDFQGKRAGNLLYEQFASLAAAEHMAGPGVDLTKDPVLRKTVFDTADKREAFRAMTGLRQTRLDSKDLAPYTRVTEKQTAPTSFLQQLLSRTK